MMTEIYFVYSRLRISLFYRDVLSSSRRIKDGSQFIQILIFIRDDDVAPADLRDFEPHLQHHYIYVSILIDGKR